MKMALSKSIIKKQPYEVDRTNKWADELESRYNQIANREKFSYDMNNDAFYKQYAQRYQQNAKLAMEDTVGQVSALTGGYGNSYAQTAGQAMYNQQMQGLNDKATELYQLALQQYNMEGDRLNNLYSMAANAYGMEQDRINAEVAEAQWNAQFAEQQRQYNLDMAYNTSRAMAQDAQFAQQMAYDYSRAKAQDAQWQKTFDYNAGRDLVADEQWQKTFDYNAGRDKVTDDRWAQEFAYQKQRDGVSDSQYAQNLAYKYAQLEEERRQFNYEKIDGAGIDVKQAERIAQGLSGHRTKEGIINALENLEKQGVSSAMTEYIYEKYFKSRIEGE
jgi:hypothetical protein